MSKEERFDKIYQDIVKADNEYMEESRKKAKIENRHNICIFIIMLLVNLIINIWVFKLIEKVSFELAGGLFTVSLAIFAAIKHRGGKSKIERYAHDFKERVVGKLVKSFDDGFSFNPDEGIESEIYDDGEFEQYDKYTSEDLIKGTLRNGCKFEMSEVLTEKKDNLEGKDKYNQVFSGLLAKVETPKTFDKYLYLRKDIKDQGFFTKILSAKLPFDEMRIEVDPKEFEKMFDIYSSDKEIVMKLFTLEIKEMLMRFQTEMKMSFEITMKNNTMYIRFRCGKMFENAKLSKYSLDKETIYKYYKMLDFSFELTNKLIELLNETTYN